MRMWTGIRQCVANALRKRLQGRWIWNRGATTGSDQGQPDWLDFHCREQATYELMDHCIGAEYAWVPFQSERYGYQPVDPAPVQPIYKLGLGPVDEEDVLDWDVWVEEPPLGRERTIMVTLDYSGRDALLPVPDPDC